MSPEIPFIFSNGLVKIFKQLEAALFSRLRQNEQLVQLEKLGTK
jgi:hypothetical protein